MVIPSIVSRKSYMEVNMEAKKQSFHYPIYGNKDDMELLTLVLWRYFHYKLPMMVPYVINNEIVDHYTYNVRNLGQLLNDQSKAETIIKSGITVCDILCKLPHRTAIWWISQQNTFDDVRKSTQPRIIHKLLTNKELRSIPDPTTRLCAKAHRNALLDSIKRDGDYQKIAYEALHPVIRYE